MASNEDARLSEFNIVIPAEPAAVHIVTERVEEALRHRPAIARHAFEITLALEEALANAIRHGCQGDATKFVQCCVTFPDEGEVLIVVRDPGSGFDVTRVPNPLEATNVLKSHGRGIFLINQLMDEVRFVDSGREVQMRKGPGTAAARGLRYWPACPPVTGRP